MTDHEMDPTGGIELTDAELGHVVGGATTGGNSDGNLCNTCNCMTTRGNSVTTKCCT